MKKRILSLLIVAVMVVGLLPMAAMAADTPVVFTVKAKSDTVAQGGDIDFELTLKTSVALTGFDIYLQIPDGLEVKSGEVPAAALTTLGVGDELGDLLSYTPGNKLLMLSRLSGTKIPSGEVTILEFTCTAAANTKGDKEVAVAFTDLGYIDAADGDAAERTTMVSATVNVPKTSYTPKTLDLSYTGTLAIQDKNFNGTAAATISGTDTDDDALPASELAKVTYTVDKAWAAVAADGTVSIKDIAAAEAGNITVTAKLGTVTTTATVAVTKAAAAVETVTVTGPTAAIIKADADQTYPFTATVKDQYGAEMAGQTIAWTTEPSTLPEGVSFADGVLTVSKDTPAASKGDVKIIATVGGKTGDITTKVTDIEFPGLADAVKVAATATYGDKWSKIVTIPATFAGKAGEATVNGTLTLKYDGEEIPAAAEEGHAFQVIFNAEGFENVVAFEGKTPAIAKKAVTIKANDVTLYVGADAAEAEYGYTATALVGDDALEGTASYAIFAMNEDGTKGEAATVSTEEPVDYIIEVSGLTASGNYALTFETGTLTVKKKSSIAPAIGTGTKPGEATGGNGQKEPVVEMVKFEDVAEDDWFYGAVEFAVSKGLFKGTSETTFAPNANMNRAMVATVLFRLDGATKTDVAAAFEDVEADTWYTDGVAWASEKEIVKGYSETVFAPNDNVTREQLAVMLYRYAGEPEVDAEMGMAGFNDVDAISEWAADAMRWAVQKGILIGKDGAMLDPTGNATRAEVATMLQRFVNLEK